MEIIENDLRMYQFELCRCTVKLGWSCHLLADSLFTGVNEVKPVKASAKVYPNPASTLLNVAIDFSGQSLYTICLYNSQGEKVICENLSKGVSLLPINNISSGVYLYRIVDSAGNLIKSGKIAVVH